MDNETPNQKLNKYQIQALRNLIDNPVPLGHMNGVGLPSIEVLISKGLVEIVGHYHDGQAIYGLTQTGKIAAKQYERRSRPRTVGSR